MAVVNRQTLDLPALESWLWEAACSIRGPIDSETRHLAEGAA